MPKNAAKRRKKLQSLHLPHDDIYLQFAVKSYNLLQNTAKRRKTPQNAVKRRNSP
jgi:hypothetical protein